MYISRLDAILTESEGKTLIDFNIPFLSLFFTINITLTPLQILLNRYISFNCFLIMKELEACKQLNHSGLRTQLQAPKCTEF